MMRSFEDNIELSPEKSKSPHFEEEKQDLSDEEDFDYKDEHDDFFEFSA